MAESLWCFEPGDRLLTMADSGEARIWVLRADGWLSLAQGRPRPPIPATAQAEGSPPPPETEDGDG